jgi:hypothetical protein
MKHMQKRLIFAPVLGNDLFEKLSDGVVIGSQFLRQADPPKDVKARTRLEAAIQRRLRSISEEVPDAARGTRIQGARALRAGPQEMVCEQAELEHIEKLVSAVPWGGLDMIAVAALYDFLSAAPVVEEPKGE